MYAGVMGLTFSYYDVFFQPSIFFPLLNLLLFIQLYFFTLLLGQTDFYVDRFIYKINNDKWSQADY